MVHGRTQLFSWFVLIPVLAACGVRELPPPAAPSKDLPTDVDMPTDESPSGMGRVVLDANGQKADVVEITGASTAYAGNVRATVVASRPVCTTPCVVDLTYGSHPLLFQSVTDDERASIAHVDVGPRVQVVRHEIGERHPPSAIGVGGVLLTTLGMVTAVTGGALWGGGAIASSADGRTSSLESTGQTVALVGLGAMVVGIPMLILGRPSERPGATTQWTLPSGGAPPTQAPAGAGAGGSNL